MVANMSFSVNEQGQLVRLVEQPVDENEIEQQLQNEMDEAQNELNTHTANVQSAEQELSSLEAQAEAKAQELEQHKANQEAAQARVTKSIDERGAWENAKRVRDEQPEPETSDATDEDADGAEDEEPTLSEAVEIPVAVG